MPTRPRVRAALNVLGVVAVCLALAPSFSYRSGTPTVAQADHVRANPADSPYTEDYTFGWAGSPLVRYHDELTLTEHDGRVAVGRPPSRTTVGLATWSFLTLAVGAGLLAAAAWLKPRPA